MKQIFLVLMLLLLAIPVFAIPKPAYILVPTCLLSKRYPYAVIAKSHTLWLLKLTQHKSFQRYRIKQPRDCRGYLNVTEPFESFIKNRPGVSAREFLADYDNVQNEVAFTGGFNIAHEDTVRPLLPAIDVEQIRTNLTRLTDLPDRYVDSINGLHAAFELQKILLSLKENSKRQDISLTILPTMNAVKQPSIILKIGNQPSDVPGILLGAHLDTIENFRERQPGADANASGVVTLIETARVLMQSNLLFKKPLYFIWYAGEEEGLLGAQTVAHYFDTQKMAIDAVLQLDETGSTDRRLSIGLTDDYTDAALTTFLADLIRVYLKRPVGAVRCGYACSDHVIWHQNGKRVAYPFALINDDGNPYVHTHNDKVRTLSFEHIQDFVKLSIAFAVELAELR